jgi:peptide/nickel transport system permease protein
MQRYILKRLLMVVPVLLGTTLLIFSMLYFSPGDISDHVMGESATEADKEFFREQNGLNDPFIVQYLRYIKGIVSGGDLGTSYTTKQPVTEEILKRFSTTFRLAGISIVIATVLGVSFGVLAAIKQNSIFDNACTFISVLGVSIPNFWQGMMMILLFSVTLGWLPPSGFSTPLHWILPTFTLGTSSAASIMRMTRASVLEVIHEDYINTAWAKGLTESRVIIVHVLKNTLIPIITVIGISFGYLMGGAVTIEAVFSIPGIGKLMVDSIKIKNSPMVQGCVLYIAFVLLILNLGIDVLYAFIDPKIRASFSSSEEKNPFGAWREKRLFQFKSQREG